MLGERKKERRKKEDTEAPQYISDCVDWYKKIHKERVISPTASTDIKKIQKYQSISATASTDIKKIQKHQSISATASTDINNISMTTKWNRQSHLCPEYHRFIWHFKPLVSNNITTKHHVFIIHVYSGKSAATHVHATLHFLH